MRRLRRLLTLLVVAVKYTLLAPLLPRVRQMSRPQRARHALQDLGATWIKLGQALALRFDILPAGYCYEFFKLLNDVHSFPYAKVEEVIGAELGCPISDAFATFEPEPFAAASIGQVHRATLHSGEKVAVKVQRPGVRKTIATDLSLMYSLAPFIDITHILGGTRSRDLIDEFARWTADELDYRVEARNADVLRRNAKGDSLEHDPRVYFDRSTARVLTLEFVEGTPLIDIMYQLHDDRGAAIAQLKRDGYDVDRVASHIVWNLLNQVYAVGFFHADLHPANLLIRPKNQIGYVDFGITGKLSTAMRQSLAVYARNLFQGDVDRAVAEFTRWVTASSATAVDAARQDLGRLLEKYLFDIRSGRRSGNPTTNFQVEMLSTIRRHRMSVAPEIVAYMKAIITVDSVVYELDPDFDLQAHENRFFGGLTLERLQQFENPWYLGGLFLDYQYRVDRALENLETLVPAERRFEDLAAEARTRVRWWAALAVLAAGGVTASVLSHRVQHYAVFGVGTRAIAIAVLALALVALFWVTRRLPSGQGRPHVNGRSARRRMPR